MRRDTEEAILVKQLESMNEEGFLPVSLQQIAIFSAFSLLPKSPGAYLFGYVDIRRKPRFVYVGGTRCLYSRWKEHRKDLLQLYWHEIQKLGALYFVFKPTATREEAMHIEAELMRKIVPSWCKHWGEIVRLNEGGK